MKHAIATRSDKSAGPKEFRELVGESSTLMCYEATRDLPLKEVEIETPIAVAKPKIIAGTKLAFVPIFRAGLGMVDGMLNLVPTARVGHIGLYRDPETHQPIQYYKKLPVDIDKREVIVLDPMLATGGSAVDAISLLKEAGVKTIKFMCIVASPAGIKALSEDQPDVQIDCGVLYEKLNDDKYIVPGLGDAGDRIFGTK